MSKLVKIEEDNLCPDCGARLFWKIIPPRTMYEEMRDVSAAPHAWWCIKCDCYYNKED